MSGQGNIKLINATELNLDYQATLIPRGGNDYPLKNGTWETRTCPYSMGVGIITDLRNPWIRQANGVPLQIGSLNGPPQFADTAPIFAYVTKHPTTPSDTIIAWSPIGRMVDPESGHDVMAGDPNYLLIAGMRPIGGKFVYNASIQNMCSWQHPRPADWTAVYGTGLPILGTNWREPDPAAHVGCFIWDDSSALFRFKGGFQGTQVGQSIYAAFRFNPPVFDPAHPENVVSPSGTEYDALPIAGNGQAFNLELSLGMKAHGADLKIMTVVAYCTAATGGRVNQGQTGVYGWF